MSCLVNGICENAALEGQQSSSSSLENGRGPQGGAPDPRMRKTNSACRACLGTFCRRLPAAEWLVPPVGFPRRAWEAGPAGQDGVAAGPETRAAAGQRPRWPPRLSTSFVQVGGQPCFWLLGLDLPWLVSWKGVRAWVTLENPTLLKDNRPRQPGFPRRKSVPGSPGDGIKAGCRDRAET